MSSLPRYKITATEDGTVVRVRYAENETQAERVYGDVAAEFPAATVHVEDREDTDQRDSLCDECACRPGAHPVATAAGYCDSRYEHEVRVITDGSVAYAYGTGPAGEDAPAVALAVSLTATETPVGGMILEAPCPQHLSEGVECPGYVRWTLSGDDFRTPIPEDLRRLLPAHGARIEDL